MKFWKTLKKLFPVFAGGGQRCHTSTAAEPEGLLVFSHTSEVIRAETLLRQAGLSVRVMGPPPDLHTGCDMVVIFPLIRQMEVSTLLAEAGVLPLRVTPLHDLLLEPVSLYQTRRLEQFLMVRAANMKICLNLETRRIVNISGGGCPDVPYLASLLVGKTIDEAEEPRLRGKTLCSYSLQKAFEEARRVTANAVLPPEIPDVSLDMGGSGQASTKLFLPSPPHKPRPWLICGIVPLANFPLTLGVWKREGKQLLPVACVAPEKCATIEDYALSIQRGTPALLASALTVGDSLGAPPPQALLVGDNGDGDGSRSLYRFLAEQLEQDALALRKNPTLAPRWEGITFHYLFPDLDGHNRVMAAVEQYPEGRGPLLAADAGYMYAAKMSGYASRYDLFTPDAGELAFLADEKAPHPFYTRGFLLGRTNDAPQLAAEAYAHGNSAQYLLIKGEQDYVVQQGRVLSEISQPLVPSMEPIGGTGDMVTGTASALLAAGYDLPQATRAAAQANRLAGLAACPMPATRVETLIPYLGKIFVLGDQGGAAPLEPPPGS